MIECCHLSISIEVFHTRDQNHVIAVGDSILEVKLCNSYGGSGKYMLSKLAANLVKAGRNVQAKYSSSGNK